jgi:hypothetical protein
MTRVLFALIALLAFAAISRAQPSSWELSFEPGGTDAQQNFMGGTEIRELVPWHPGLTDAKLYAGNGYWMDQPGPEGFQTAQVLVLNSPGEEWRQDKNFGDFCASSHPKCALAISSLASLYFTSDENLTPVSVSVLVASTWNVGETPDPVKVYAKNNTDGSWHETRLTVAKQAESDLQVRAFGVHVDQVTHQDWAFAGGTMGGIFHGLLSANRGAKQNIIKWVTGSENMEFVETDYQGPPCTDNKLRLSTFAEAGRKEYATICHQIYVRIDGAQGHCKPSEVEAHGNHCQPRWKPFWTDPEPAYSETGLRGLTKVVYQGKDVLLVGGEGYLIHIYRIDPDTGVGVAEFDVLNYLSNHWNMDVGYTITSYNGMPIWYDEDGIGKRIIGLESFLSESTTIPLVNRSFNLRDQGDKLEGNAWYIVRNAAASYELIHILQVVTSPMTAVRAVATSPFSNAAFGDLKECNAQGVNCAIYFGGYDANHSTTATPCLAGPCVFQPNGPLVPVPTHNTAWIVKGVFPK